MYNRVMDIITQELIVVLVGGITAAVVWANISKDK
jgi:hypothetical protein